MTTTLTLVGLGPGDPRLLTRAAEDHLHQAPAIFTPTPKHPALSAYRARVQATDRTTGYGELCQHLARTGSACYALPGNPRDTPATIANLCAAANRPEPPDYAIIPGVSLLDAFFAALAGGHAGTRPAPLRDGFEGFVVPRDSRQTVTCFELEQSRLQGLVKHDLDSLEPRPWIETQGAGRYQVPATTGVAQVQPRLPLLLWQFAPHQPPSAALQLGLVNSLTLCYNRPT